MSMVGSHHKYERFGLISAAKRVNGERRHASATVKRLSFIQLAQQAGFTFAEIKTLLEGFEKDIPSIARWRTLAHKKLEEVEVAIARAQKMKSFSPGRTSLWELNLR